MAEMRNGVVAFAVIGFALIAPSLGWAARVGAPAPDFTATDTNGKVHKSDGSCRFSAGGR